MLLILLDLDDLTHVDMSANVGPIGSITDARECVAWRGDVNTASEPSTDPTDNTMPIGRDEKVVLRAHGKIPRDDSKI